MRIESSVRDLHRVLSALVTHASKDTTRPHLNCVAFGLTDAGKVSACATDGHRLAHWACDTMTGIAKRSAPRLLVSVADVKSILVALKPHMKALGASASIAGVAGRFTIRLTNDVRGKATVRQSIRTFDSFDSRLTFPPFHEVFPKLAAMGCGKGHRAVMNPKYVIDAAKVFAEASDVRVPQIVIVTDTNDSRAPIVFRSPAEPRLTIIVMPSLTDDVCDWSAHVTPWRKVEPVATPKPAAVAPAVAAE